MPLQQTRPDWHRHLEGGAELIEQSLPFYDQLLTTLERGRPEAIDADQRRLAERLAVRDGDVGAAIDAVDLALARGELPLNDPLVARKEQLVRARLRLAQLAGGAGAIPADLPHALERLDAAQPAPVPAATEPEAVAWKFDSLDAAARAHAGAEIATMDVRAYKKVDWPGLYNPRWSSALAVICGGLASSFGPQFPHQWLPGMLTYAAGSAAAYVAISRLTRVRRVVCLTVFENGIGFMREGCDVFEFEPWSNIASVRRKKGVIRLNRRALVLPQKASADSVLELMEGRLAERRAP